MVVGGVGGVNSVVAVDVGKVVVVGSRWLVSACRGEKYPAVLVWLLPGGHCVLWLV